MLIEYRVKDSEELRDLEDAMQKFPCYLGEIGVEVENGGIMRKSVGIRPLLQDVLEIKVTPGKASFVALNLGDDPYLIISNKSEDDYTYLVHLKPKK